MLCPRWVRRSIAALLLLSGVFGFWLNQAQLTTPISGRFVPIREPALSNKAIYLVDTRSVVSLLLTKSDDNTGMPSFHPKEDALAAVIHRPKDSTIWEIGGLQPYIDRLYHPGDVQVLPKP